MASFPDSIGRAAVLDSLDPAAAPDDLEPLRALADGARVVAVGEGAHFVSEFAHARVRAIRFLVERCGFSVLALEIGDAQARAIAPWLAGDGAEDDLLDLLGPLGTGVFGETLRGLRRHLREPVLLVGVDLPNTLTPSPDLDPVIEYLHRVDPETAAQMADVCAAAARITGGSAAASAPSWAALGTAAQDALTAGLARLELRLRALEPDYVARAGRERYDTARVRLEAARHTDYSLRSMNRMYAGDGLPNDTSIRDHFIAESVRRLLDDSGDDRVVLLAHNNHVQKVPVVYDGYPAALPAGHHLDIALGDSYRALGMTHTADRIPEMDWPAEGSPVGFIVQMLPMEPPPPASLERALVDAGLGDAVTLTDLRHGTAPLERVRAQSAVMDLAVARAFDAVLTVPHATLDPTLPF